MPSYCEGKKETKSQVRNHHQVQCCCAEHLSHHSHSKPTDTKSSSPAATASVLCCNVRGGCAQKSTEICSAAPWNRQPHPAQAALPPDLGPEGNCATLNTARQHGGHRSSAGSGWRPPCTGRMTCVRYPGRLSTLPVKKNPKNKPKTQETISSPHLSDFQPSLQQFPFIILLFIIWTDKSKNLFYLRISPSSQRGS